MRLLNAGVHAVEQLTGRSWPTWPYWVQRILLWIS